MRDAGTEAARQGGAGSSLVLCTSLALWLAGASACRDEAAPRTNHRGTGTSPSATGGAPPAALTNARTATRTADQPDNDTHPLRRCFPADPAWTVHAVHALLDEASRLFEQQDSPGALACAEEAARRAPQSIEAHHDRAVALAKLGRLEEARDAVTLVLAQVPDDAHTLELAADLYINALAPSAERATIGLAHVRRAMRAVPRAERAQRGRLALLEGQALLDLGRAREALAPLELALTLDPQSRDARYEHAVALFELSHFDRARDVLATLLQEEPDHAHAHFHMGLVFERGGDFASADRHLARAQALRPQIFPAGVTLSSADFAERVRAVVATLPGDVREDLAGVPVTTEELPALEDLVAEAPPLSPTILGLFRGAPLGSAGTDRPQPHGAKGRTIARVARPPSRGGPAGHESTQRTIILYRRNLLRSLTASGGLDGAIQRTLLHEVGHLRGEDDGSLRDRGLE